MHIHQIPDDIFPGTDALADGIIIHDYTAEVGSFKGKSILNSNAISLVIEGEKTMHFAKKVVSINNDEFHFLSASNCLATINLSPRRNFRSILIFFTDKLLLDFHLKHASLIDALRKKYIPSPESYVSFKKDPFVYNFIDSLQLLLKKNTRISKEMSVLKFEELILYLVTAYPQSTLSFEMSGKKDMEDMELRKVVESNTSYNISIEELAFLCNMSLSTFKRRFSKIYDCLPGKWLVQQKMDMAARLLEHEGEKPGNIYHLVGYENHSSFSAAFKQAYGVTPTEFQQQKLNVYQ
ncbi:MAG: AraC family transcriptional regulator [Chitinophagaceae bacterium]